MGTRFNVLTTAFISVLLCFSCNNEAVVETNGKAVGSCDINFDLNVYMENSGSMDGYMCAKSDLKEVVYSYVSDLSLSKMCDTTALYYINSEPIPYHNELREFVRDLTPASFKNAGGNRGNSDLTKMIDYILDDLDTRDVSVFVSDCILDLPSADATDYLGLVSTDIANTVAMKLKSMPDMAVQVVMLDSKFSGKYYYSHGGAEQLVDVQRPYYMWIFGSNHVLAKINEVISPRDLKGYLSSVSFVPSMEVLVKVSNTFETSRELRERNGGYRLLAQTDLAPTLLEDDELCDIDNYVVNPASIHIAGIEHPTVSDTHSTHRFEIEVANFGNCEVSLLRQPLPSWVNDANDETGCDIKDNMSKTTGIKSLIEGVATAYQRQGDKLVTFRFLVKKK